MRTKLVLLLISLLLLLAIGCSKIKATDALNFVLSTDHYDLRQTSYGKHPRQQLSIYLPKTVSNKPPIFFVYGGAWREGERNDYAFVAHALTGLGHTVIIPDYRLYPEVHFPVFINDIAAAIRYTELNAETLLDKPLQPYVLMGHSAGAHSAALLASDQRYLQQYQVNTQPSGLIALAGPHDLPLNDPEVKPVFTGATTQTAQPLSFVHKNMPPVLLLHGEADKRVYPFHSRNFATKLKQAGARVKTLIYPGVNHTQIIGSLAAPLRMLNTSYDDIKKFLATL